MMCGKHLRDVPDRVSLHLDLDTTIASMNENEEDQERIETVSQFLLQSPPGEINDVLNGTIGSSSRYSDRSQHLTTPVPCRCSRAHRG